MTPIHTLQGTRVSQPVYSALTTAQRHIVDFCSKGRGTYTIPSSSSLDSQVFVKRGCWSLEAEARTQVHIYAQAQSSGLDLHVPKVYDVFSDGNASTYLVMEHIAAPSFHAWISEPNLSADEQTRRADVAVDKIASTIEVLLRCPLPEGNGIGPVGGGLIQHSFFCMEDAPVPFVNTAALEIYVNRALNRRPGRPQERISLETEARLICPSDVTLENFLWDPVKEQVWMVDFRYVNILPHSFASFYFHCTSDRFVEAVAKKISLPVSSKLLLLESAAIIVMQSGFSSLGLDEYGAVKPRRRSRRSHIA